MADAAEVDAGPYTDAQLADGTTLRFRGDLDPISVKEKVTQYRAGVGGPAPQPLAPKMVAAGAQHERNEEQLAEAEHRAMNSPTPFTNAASIMYPAAELPEAIAAGGLKTVAKGAARGIGKIAAGTGVGAGVGAGVGTMVGHPKEGAELGGAIGGIAAPLAPDAWFARAPYGINRVILGEEGLANERAAAKVAQRNADIAAGLRKPPMPPEPLPGIPGATSTGSTIGNEALPPAAARGGMTSTGPTPITMTGPAVAPGKTAKLPGQVLRVPEPSGGDPRWMASVPRGKLPGLAAQGREGAAEQLQNIGKTVLIEPRGGDIANVRERTTFGSEGNVAETRQIPPEERVQTPGAVPRNAFGEPIPATGRSAPAAPAAPLKISKDSVGITWAEDANGVRVSIPKSVPPENVEQYARQQIDQQAKAQAQLKGEIGKSAATPTEPPKLTDEQVRDARAQVADLRKRALAYRDKMSASRGWRTANEHMRMQQQLEEKASQIERDLGQGKPAAPKAEPAKVDLSATYNNASPEIKKQVDQLADEYKNIESYEKAHFEHDYNLNSSLTKGLPIKEKLARYLSARGAKP